MPRVICKLPNASNMINGVTFYTHKLGVISEEVDEDSFNAFLSVPGFYDYETIKEDAKATAIASQLVSNVIVPDVVIQPPISNDFVAPGAELFSIESEQKILEASEKTESDEKSEPEPEKKDEVKDEIAVVTPPAKATAKKK